MEIIGGSYMLITSWKWVQLQPNVRLWKFELIPLQARDKLVSIRHTQLHLKWKMIQVSEFQLNS